MIPTLVVSVPPTTEPITVSEVKTWSRLDGTNFEPAPGYVTVALVSPAAAGNVDVGAHRYLATFVTASGETEAGAASVAVSVADKTVNGKVQVSAIPLGGSAVTARKLYRTVAGGSSFLFLATIEDNTTTTYVDNVADSALGAGAPAANTTDDPLLMMLIPAARAHAEQMLGRYIITQTVDAYFDRFPGPHSLYASAETDHLESQGVHRAREIRLPPLQSVSSIKYFDDSGVEQTLAADQYLVDAVSVPARIEPAFDTCWPSTRRQANAVHVTFIAGYGAANAVPMCIKQWIALRIKTLWDNREAISTSESRATQLVMPSDFVDSLLDPERVVGFL